MSRVNSQAIYAMNSRDTRTKSLEFGWELIISLIKPHMTNQITTGGISNNLEEFIRVYLDQATEIDPPHLQMMVKYEYVEYARMKSTAIDTLEKVKARCSKCDHHLRGKHKFVICQTCFENK